jgi:hypothetical protein
MRTGPLIVDKIAVQRSPQRSLIPHDHVVQALASDGAHQPLRKGILPGGSRRSKHFLDSHIVGHGSEVCSVDGISIAHHISGCLDPDAEQRLWRTVTRKKYQLRCDRVRLQNQLESLLEEAHIKLSSFVSDLLGLSAQRMLKALADGETNPAALAALADVRLRATPEQLCDALGACTELNAV